jgi:cytoskeletal protein CcmA (bactofilin family)
MLAQWYGEPNALQSATRRASLESGKFYSLPVTLPATRICMTPLAPGDLENSSRAGKCTLSSDVEIEGSIKFQNELLIDGKVQGQINSDGVLTIGENADICGEIKTKFVTVYGKVHGNITAERCELKSKCTLQGDLKAARLIVEEGAAFIGTSQNTLAGTLEKP